MTGQDVKRQAMEALVVAALPTNPQHVPREESGLAAVAHVALAPCVVLTPEEARELSRWFGVGTPSRIYALLTPQEEPTASEEVYAETGGPC